MYAIMTIGYPYLDESSQPIRFWANKYKTKFGDDPSTYSAGAYEAMDIFIQAAQKAGPNLTTDSFIKAVEGLGKIPPDFFGSTEMQFTPTQRLGSTQSRLSQIQDGRWKIVSGYR